MTRAAEALAALLRDQRGALLAGDLDTLAAMPERLERTMRQVATGRPPPETLVLIGALAADNARLLDAARGGLAALASRRHAAAPQLSTYDARGQRAAAPTQGQVLARR
jgi:hypothetical protein